MISGFSQVDSHIHGNVSSLEAAERGEAGISLFSATRSAADSGRSNAYIIDAGPSLANKSRISFFVDHRPVTQVLQFDARMSSRQLTVGSEVIEVGK